MSQPLSEFDIIHHYFHRAGLAADPARQPHVALSIGDDCALLRVPENRYLALSMDILNEGVHFPAAAPADLVASRALAVNLSDLAAMGAEPLGFTLGLTLPQAESKWLALFSEGLLQMAQRYHCPLLGGDITRGPLAITIQVHGLVDPEKSLLRSGAREGDLVLVTGTLGDAVTGLKLVQGELDEAGLNAEERSSLVDAYYRPEPRLAAGTMLSNHASAAIDISDGLLADLGHIARASGLRIELQPQALPISALNIRLLGEEQARSAALSGGDDYELAFTLAPASLDIVILEAKKLGVLVTEVGKVLRGSGVACDDGTEESGAGHNGGYRHF